MTIVVIILILLFIVGAFFVGYIIGLATGGCFDGYKAGREAVIKRIYKTLDSLREKKHEIS